MPKPTPWIASKTPSQSHRARPASAPATGPPGIQGTHSPKPDVAHSICAQRGAPRPMAKMGTIHEWLFDRCPNSARKPAHTPTKKAKTSRVTAHVGAYVELHRYA